MVLESRTPEIPTISILQIKNLEWDKDVVYMKTLRIRLCSGE